MTAAAVATVAGLLQGTMAWAGQAGAAGVRTPAPGPGGPNMVAPKDRGKALGKGWKKSNDRAWTTAGDATGFHVLVADANAGYTWRTAATLSEPGLETDQWIGNACVTGSGKRAVVVYAPRAFTNREYLFDRGAFTAVVDLGSGKVTKLPLNASLAYFNPGCGAGETAVVTQANTDGKSEQTQLQTIDAATGKIVSTGTVDGQATSAVPVGRDVIAAAGSHLIKVNPSGKADVVTATHGTAMRLHPDADGNVAFLEPAKGGKVNVQHLEGKKVKTLASGKLGQVGLAQGAYGKVFVTGQSKESDEEMPSTVRRVTQAPAQAELSTDGKLAIAQATPHHLADKVANPLERARTSVAEPVEIKATATNTKKDLAFAVATEQTPAQASTGGKPSPLLPFIAGGKSTVKKALAVSGAKAADASGDPSTNPVDDDRYCSVARNDVNTQVYQPTPNQVEWAADMAIRGQLTSGYANRPSNWHNSGLASWTPQGMFPPHDLVTGKGGRVPAQVLLGILAQESNLWQASSHAEPGEYGNPLIGNFYGTSIYPSQTGYDPKRIWKINWDHADCGYGIGQATDGMRIAGHPKEHEVLLPPDQQRAVAVDYATGIAYSVRILQDKWNELHSGSTQIKLNDDDPSHPENWFAAVWDYNAGLNVQGSNPDLPDAWGLGWANNPANPKYPADRNPFLDNNHYADAAKPQNWSYEEKVMGWGAYPIDAGHSWDDNGNINKGNTHGFSAAWWRTPSFRSAAIKPPLGTFCDSSNGCDPVNPPVCHTVACYNTHWFHHDTTWQNCGAAPNPMDPSSQGRQCGNEYLTYKTLRGEPGDAHPKLGPCDSGALPNGTVLVDDEPDDAPQNRCASRNWSSNGSFSWQFGKDDENHYEAKEDLHQIGGGFGGHYWFSHARQPNDWDNYLTTNGTWTPKLSDHVYKIQAFIPYPSHTTKSAHYEVTTANGKVREKIIDQSKANNDWVTVGYFQLGSNAKVSLSNVTSDSTSGDLDVAYDALAFVPVNGKYEHHTFDAVAIFDENQDLGTDTPWFFKTPLRTMTTLKNWAVERSHGGPDWTGNNSYTRGITDVGECPTGPPGPSCVGHNTYAAAKDWYDEVVAAGDSPTNHPAGHSEAEWMGYAVPRPGDTIDPDNSFTDDTKHKIKTHIDAAYLIGDDGKVVPGSEDVSVRARTGSTHLPGFMLTFMKALQQDYGIAPPNLAYDEMDANVYSGNRTHVDGLANGSTPGQAYIPNVTGPRITPGGDCLETRSISGGTIGYRPLVAQKSVQDSAAAWSKAVKAAADSGHMPQEVATLAGDIKSMFFNPPNALGGSLGVDGSLFNAAPPIWQNVSLAFCANGKLKSTQTASNSDSNPSDGLVYQSYMPDLYLFEDGKAIDNAGNPSSGPVRKGDFRKFSGLPDGGPNAYDKCDTAARGSGGNPWNITAIPLLADPNERPKFGQYCDNKQFYDRTYTP
ncbi:hypothetical protein [Streptomyces orinoci]|uniref:Golvesin/Xly CBD-like domain-containing protein n=1 Tax=Streptomyces orinoci TaxID=67339 RepID=A0ABV3JZC0_STRON|nr:hypothetical protein [Streptomyces orinoci]